MEAPNDDEYFVPLEDQRVFGAGIKRKRVAFVPPSQDAYAAESTRDSQTQDVGNYYLSLVLPTEASRKEGKSQEVEKSSRKDDQPESIVRCEICQLPMSSGSDSVTVRADDKPHEASLAHQVCLTHSHPPSHLDRSHKGLQYLASYGWDPDDRQGLGATGAGIRFPIRAVAKRDNAGVGVRAPNPGESWAIKKKEEKLDAKQIRKREEDDTKRRHKLQQIFYGNGDVEKYLGSAS